MARFWMFTADHSGLPLAIRLAEESHNVTLALIRPEERTGRWEKPKDQKDVKTNEERLEYLVKNGKGLVPHVWASDAITAHADTPEGAYAKIRELYNSFNLSTLWARDDYQQDKEVNFPLYRFHLMKKLKLI